MSDDLPTWSASAEFVGPAEYLVLRQCKRQTTVEELAADDSAEEIILSPGQVQSLLEYLATNMPSGE